MSDLNQLAIRMRDYAADRQRSNQERNDLNVAAQCVEDLAVFIDNEDNGHLGAVFAALSLPILAAIVGELRRAVEGGNPEMITALRSVTELLTAKGSDS